LKLKNGGKVMELKNTDLKKLYADMWGIRLFEGHLAEAFAKGDVPGFVHLGIGQEATMAGTCFNIGEGDTIGGTHREHGVLLCKGADPKRIMAEIYGRKDGMCKGKGGSMHACDLSIGALGNGAILGTSQTIINGYAYYNKLQNNGKVAITMYGDGQSNRGDVYEGMNLAATWNLPTIYIVVNNGYALSTPKAVHQKQEDVSSRGAGFGMPGVRVDGNDILAVIEASGEAIKRAREGKGPSILQYDTYRWHGHFEGDPKPYRTKEEEDMWKNEKDPIKRFEAVLLERGAMTEAEMKDAKAEKEQMVAEARDFSLASPLPPTEWVYTDVYFKA
jgi:TPP-dependent pyruvate/acetoin dehydrogenase alpha subunit